MSTFARRASRLSFSFVCTVVALGGGAACYTVDGLTAAPAPAEATSTASAKSDGGTVTEAGATGLPCDVEALLTTKCATCHTSPPTAAPMALVSYEDLVAPSRSDGSISTAQASLARMKSTTSPMPPSNPLPEADIAVFEKWVLAGTPKTSCETAATVSRRDASAVECVLASDCPGSLVCKSGVCDIECATDKDCYPTWSCEATRCTPPHDAPVLPDAGTPTVYGDFADTKAWQGTSIATVTGSTFSGGVTDGRYMYFAPDNTAAIPLRYDTQGSFTSMKSWATFDLTTMNASAKGYRGTIFDGRYVYFVPLGSGLISRYDTRGAFLDPAAWTIFNLATVGPQTGFNGGTFDGRYIYLAPVGGTTAFRYDTQAPFASTRSWSRFTIGTVDAKAQSFVGAVYDGRNVYFVPFAGAGTLAQGTIARYDSELPFGTASSWSTLDLTTLDAAAMGYRSGLFDGRYLYLVPGWMAPTPSWGTTKLARFDTQADFKAAESWTFFDTTTLAPEIAGFNAAAFDGRHIVFAPGYNGTAYHGSLLRYDTHGALDAAESWGVFETQSLGNSRTFRGAAFDGRHVYFAPNNGTAVRFEARTPAAMPAFPLGGSFY